jgi:hypothetical protein
MGHVYLHPSYEALVLYVLDKLVARLCYLQIFFNFNFQAFLLVILVAFIYFILVSLPYLFILIQRVGPYDYGVALSCFANER